MHTLPKLLFSKKVIAFLCGIRKCRNILPVLLLLKCIDTFCQAGDPSVTIIEIDSLTRTMKSRVPFDKPFILKVRSDTKPPYVDYIANKGRRSWNNTINYYLRTYKILGMTFRRTKSVTFSTVPTEQVTTGKENGISYIYIRFDDYPYRYDHKGKLNNFLKPGKNYTVVIPKLYEQSMDIFGEYANGNYDRGSVLINNLRSKQFDAFGLYYNVPTPILARQFFNTDLADIYLDIDTLQTTFQSNSTAYSSLSRLYQSSLIRSLLDHLTTRDPGLFLPDKYIDTLTLVKSLQSLYTLYVVQSGPQLLQGACTLEDTTVITKGLDVEKRLSQLGKVYDILNQAYRYAGLLIEKGLLTDTDNELPDIRRVLTQLQTQRENLSKQKEYAGTIRKKVIDCRCFVEPTIIAGSSQVFDFKTRSKLQITPDFGYVWYGYQHGFSSFTPYVGFQVNFRPVDKDIPWKIYPNKTLWHRLSFSTGWSLTGVAQENKRENFFSGSSLLTGLGIKLTNAIKINTGALWFYQKDPNPLLEKRELKSVFYAGLSIDLDIKELLNDFTSLKPNVK